MKLTLSSPTSGSSGKALTLFTDDDLPLFANIDTDCAADDD